MTELITLSEDSPSVQYLCKKDKRFEKVVHMVGPISYRLHDDSYEFLVGQIINQMLSNKVADIIYARLEQLCGGHVEPHKIAGLTDEEIKGIGTANSKVRYIRAITEAVLNKDIDFSELKTLDDTEVIKKLTSIKGIGIWTAKMYLIFALGRQDVLPYEDVAFLQTYKWLYKTENITPTAIIKKCKKWKPYSSIAARYFYHALDAGLTKQTFHLHK